MDAIIKGDREQCICVVGLLNIDYDKTFIQGHQYLYLYKNENEIFVRNNIGLISKYTGKEFRETFISKIYDYEW